MAFFSSFFCFPAFAQYLRHCMSQSLLYFAVPGLCCVSRLKWGACEDCEGMETPVDELGSTRTMPEDKDKDTLEIVRQPILSVYLSVLCYIPQAASEKKSRLCQYDVNRNPHLECRWPPAELGSPDICIRIHPGAKTDPYIGNSAMSWPWKHSLWLKRDFFLDSVFLPSLIFELMGRPGDRLCLMWGRGSHGKTLQWAPPGIPEMNCMWAMLVTQWIIGRASDTTVMRAL